jgi:hypothetical protein
MKKQQNGNITSATIALTVSDLATVDGGAEPKSYETAPAIEWGSDFATLGGYSRGTHGDAPVEGKLEKSGDEGVDPIKM